MTDEELLEIAKKIRSGTATDEEKSKFADQLNTVLDEASL